MWNIYLVTEGIRTIAPRLGLGFGSRSGLVLGGNQTISPEKDCPPFSIRVWLRVLAQFWVWRTIFLRGNCPRTASENTYLMGKSDVFKTSIFYVWKVCLQQRFGELQLTQISLNFNTSCCNLKIRGLGATLCVAFVLFFFWKELWRFKIKESVHFVKARRIRKWKIPHTVF